jgi:translocation and assembly module TamB
LKTLKILFISIVFVVSVAFIGLLNSKYITQKVFDYIAQSTNITYSKLDGTLWQGLHIDDLDYNNQIQIKQLYINPSILSLLWLEIYLYELEVLGVGFDMSLLENDSNSQEELNIPLNSLYIKSLKSSFADIKYDTLDIKNLQINGSDISYDFKTNINAHLDIKGTSNIGDIQSNIHINNTKYELDSSLNLNLEFINQLTSSNLSHIDNILLNIKGDTNSFDFQASSKTFSLIQNNQPIKLDNILANGTYDIKAQDIVSNIKTLITYEDIVSKIDTDVSIKNHDISSLQFSLNADTTIPQAKQKYFQNDIVFRGKFLGNLSKIDFDTTLLANTIINETIPIKLPLTSLKGTLHINEDYTKIQSVFDLIFDVDLDSNMINFSANKANFQLDTKTNDLKLNGNFKTTSTISKTSSDFELIANLNKLENMVFSSKSLLSNLKYNDLDLSFLEPLALELGFQHSTLKANLKSELFEASINTNDFKKFLFDVNIKELNPNDLYEIPTNLKINSLKANLKGQYENDLILDANVILNKNFVLNSSINGNLEDFNATIKNKSFNTKITSTKNGINSKTSISSLGDFEKEVSKILDISPLNLAGKLDIVILSKDDIWSFDITSPKITYDKSDINKLYVVGFVKDNFLFFDKFNFTISDLFDISLQKDFVLKTQAYFDMETFDSYIDFGDVAFKTKKLDDTIRINIDTKDLFMAHSSYGSGFVTSELVVDYTNGQVLIGGDMHLKNLTAIYEAPNSSINRDKDIIIISKNKENITKRDFFVEDIALELALFVDKFNYSVKNINLEASSVLYLKKAYGGNTKIYGSLQDISGSYDELGRTYLLKNSNLYFRGLEPIDPILDIHALHKLEEVDISINIGGTLNSPRINLHSTPIMSQRDILSYLIFGTRFASNPAMNEQSKSSQVSLFLVNELSKDYAKELGLDVLYFEYDQTNQYIETVIGKNISKKSMVILKNKADGGRLILQRELTKRWNVELGFEDNTQGIDLMYQKRY